MPTRSGSPWIVLGVVSTGVLMEAMDASIATVANPSIAADLHTGLDTLQWVVNAYLIAQAVLLIAAGNLGDRFGHRRVFFIGLVGFVTASLLVALSGGMISLIAFRLLQGAFGAMLLPSALGILRGTFPADQLKLAISVFMGAFVVGGVLGPVVGGLVLNHAGWRWVFLINVPLGALALVLGLLTIRRNRIHDDTVRPMDLSAVLLLALTLLGLLVGLSQGPYRGWTSPVTLASYAVAIGFGTLFVLRERAARAPLLPPHLFRTRPIIAAVLLTLLVGGLAFGSWYYVILYLQNIRDHSPLAAGLYLLPVTAAFVVGSPLGGLLNQRFGSRTPLLTGLVLVGAGLGGLSQLDGTTPGFVIWPLLVATGLGTSFVTPTAMEVIVGNTPEKMAGVASGLGQTALLVGNAIGVSGIGTIIAAGVRGSLPDHLADQGVPAGVGAQLSGAVGQLAEGRVPAVSPEFGTAVRSAAHSAFLDGLQVGLLVACLTVSACVVLLIAVPRARRAVPDRTDTAQPPIPRTTA
ncbi:MFS transporter [Actinosynnema sp. ALI-1.44]|uniref:MFS transporter n=1 Tax=Actinosynnema sp. ALI-1.44 TaxID=1933779 RepID=UPI00143CCB93|nr:MFS transporter [Actinosynnema sp. ALI-1.44]